MGLEFRQACNLTQVCEEIDCTVKTPAPVCIMVCGHDGEAKIEFVESLTSKLRTVVLHSMQEVDDLEQGFLEILGTGYLVVLDEKQSYNAFCREQLSVKLRHAGANTIIGIHVDSKVELVPENDSGIKRRRRLKDATISVPQASEFDKFLYVD